MFYVHSVSCCCKAAKCNLFLYTLEHLEVVYKKAIESLTSFEDAEFHTSFSPFEEHQIIDQCVNHLKNLYTNSEEVICRFQALSKSLQDSSVSIFLYNSLEP